MAESTERLSAALSGRYRVEREIGAGGMATVYLAADEKHHRQVALKVLRHDLSASMGADRFVREIGIAAALTHPHILPLYDSGEAGGFLYYVMPYVDGESLREKLLRGGELPIADAVRILRDVADGMAYAHKRGVVHRDLKPENVMLADRHALVTDFGVAKAVTEATGRQTLTTAGVALGTPSYMSPEQATADPHLDHRSDIYSFGVLAYELLAGRPPFAGGSPQEVLARHVTTAAEPVTTLRASVPPALAALVMRCLEKKPADRWQSAEEIIPQLEALLTPSGGITPTATQPYAAASHRSAARRRMMLMAAAVLIASVGGYAAWRGWRGRAAAAPASRIVVAWFDNRTGDSSLADIGALAAEWISDGLSNASIGTVVPGTFVRELMTGELKDSSARAQALARKTTATVLVSGVYSKRGDTLEFKAEVLDFVGGRVLANVGPVRGQVQETSVFDSLFQQVAVALAVRGQFGERASLRSRPRNLAALREFQLGDELFNQSDWRGSIPHFAMAAELDTAWISPYLSLAPAFGNLGDPAAAESVLAIAKPKLGSAPPSERFWWEWLHSVQIGDLEAMYRAGRRIVSEDPRNTYSVAFPAVLTGRFREVLAMAASRDTNAWNRNWLPWETQIVAANHFLGRFDEELRVARANATGRRSELGVAALAIRPLAALGKYDEVNALLAQVWEMPAAAGIFPANLAQTAGLEYIAHGYPDRAPAVFQKRLDWHLARTPEQRTAQAGYALNLAYAYFDLGRWREAIVLFDSLATAAPTDVARVGILGVSVAMAGDTARAREIDGRLAAISRPFLNGANTLWRSRIAAALGHCSLAAEQMRTAFNAGVSRGNFLHHLFAARGRARECTALKDALAPRD